MKRRGFLRLLGIAPAVVVAEKVVGKADPVVKQVAWDEHGAPIGENALKTLTSGDRNIGIGQGAGQVWSVEAHDGGFAVDPRLHKKMKKALKKHTKKLRKLSNRPLFS